MPIAILLWLLVVPDATLGEELACVRSLPSSWGMDREIFGRAAFLEPTSYVPRQTYCCLVDPFTLDQCHGE